MTENELVRLYGVNPLIQNTVESACNSTGSCGTAEKVGRICRNKQSLLRYVVQRAQELGTWIEIDDILGEMIGNGQENDVFISRDGQSVIKLNNFGLLPDSANSLVGFIHRLQSHNKLFLRTIIPFLVSRSTVVMNRALFSANHISTPCVMLQMTR